MKAERVGHSPVMIKMRQTVLLMFLCGLMTAKDHGPVTTSVCKLLAHPERYSGKMVTVTAELKFPRRMSLVDEKCGRILLAFPGDEETRPEAHFTFIEDSQSQSLKNSLSEMVPPPPYKPGHVFATFEGRFDSVYALRRGRMIEKDPASMRLARDEFRLVLHRVAGVKVEHAHRPAPGNLCSPTSETQHTHWGHDHTVLDFQAKPFKAVTGAVEAAYNKPIEGALVEIYQYHAHDPLPQQADQTVDSPPRLAACVTGEAGKFGFDLPSGRYEVRVSKPGWNSTSALVVVDVRGGKRRSLTVPLKVGT